MRDDEDDYDSDDAPLERPAIPGIVRAAGVIWMVYGIVGLFSNILGFVLQAADNANNGGGGGAPGGGNPGSPCCGIAIAVAFAYCGKQTFRGESKDVLGNSIGSFLFGLLQAVVAVVLILVGAEVIPNPGGMFDPAGAILVGAIVLFMASMLFVAATLALLGRRGYLEWRAIAHPKKKKRRRPQRDEEDEDEDDR